MARNAGAQALTFALRASSSVVLLSVLGHRAGPQQVGSYTFALQFTTMLTFLAGLGLQNLLVRETSRAPEDTRSWIDLTSGLLLASGVLTVFTSLVAAAALPHTSTGMLIGVGLAAIGLVGQTFGGLLSGAFYARERMGVETRATLVAESSFLLLGLLVLFGGGTALGLVAAYAASRLVLPTALLRTYRANVGPIRPTLSWSLARPLLRRCVPFCLDDLLTATYVRADVTLLQVFRGAREVGLYTSATLLTMTANVLARVLNWSLFPRLSRTAGTPAFRATVATSVRLLMLVGMPLAVGPFLLGRQVMDVLWGNRFDAALPCYLLLTLVVPVRFLGHTTGTALTATDRQTSRTWAVGAAAVLNVGLNLWLIPTHGFLGAGVATLVTETALTATYSLLLLRAVGTFCRAGDLARPALATVPMALVLLLLRDHAALVLTIAAGAATYTAAAVAVGAVTMAELHRGVR